MANRIGQLFEKVAGKAFSRHGGPLMIELVRVWDVLCPEVAAFTRPEAVRRSGPGPAVLKLLVTPGRALEVQMLEPMLLERINDHFGAPVIGRVKLVQAPLKKPGNETAQSAGGDPLPPPDEALLAALRQRLDRVRDEELRATLARMAEGIARKAAQASETDAKSQ